MKNSLVLASILIFSSAIFAQPELPEEPLTNQSPYRTMSDAFSVGDTVFVFGDKINVRSTPAKDGAVAAQLLIGEQVIVRDTAAFLTLDGREQRWLKISFLKNGRRQEGYVWGGLLAFGWAKAGNVRLLYGLGPKRTDPDGKGDAIEFRAVKDGKMLASVGFPAFYERSFYSQTWQIPNLGLTQFQGGMKAHLGFDACGYQQTDMYVFWDGSKLVKLPELVSSADGGVFWHSEEYIFPLQRQDYGDEQPSIFLKVNHGESGENDEEEFDEWTKLRRVRWNGREFVKPKIED